MSDLTPREKVFRAADDDVQLSSALDNYRSTLIQDLTESLAQTSEKARIVLKLREMDKGFTEAEATGDRNPHWWDFIKGLEDVLGVPRGTLDTGPYGGEEPEHTFTTFEEWKSYSLERLRNEEE